ncbi:MAG TPA: aldehyde dehydrogenase (NADP(+)) [Prolixibacteraceae bacterium]|nr:aldehyde dehydrogenase (NADP(+)) [Prolixibacteraceae bacterium]
MELTGKNLIGNEESGKGITTFFAKNPATQEYLSTRFFEATTSEVDESVAKAKNAFHIYKAKSNEERAVFLETIAENILELGDTLIKKCMLETALPEARLTGERMRTVNQLRMFASVVREGSWIDARIDTAIPGRQPVPKPDIRQMQIPLGPVGIFGASNFPFAFSVAGGDTVSALAAGCPVIVKAHPLHPGTSEMVGKAILKAARQTKMPEGIFSLVQGISNEVGMAIVNHPEIKAIGFTGSFKGGKAIFDAANSRAVPIPVFAEMGSVNPVFILPGALKERNEIIAKGLIGAVSIGVGQFCTNPGLVVTLKSDDAKQFLQNLKISNSENPSGIMLSEQIKNNFSKGTQNLLSSENVSLISSGSGEETGNRVNPKVFSTDFETFINDGSLSEEVFGPSTLLVSTNNKSEMLQLAAKLEGHLTATIHGTEKDLNEYSELIHILEQKVGRLIFNGFPTGVEVCHSMVHGGPYPATTAPQSTSVGTAAIKRFARPICYQDFPQSVLPEQLKDNNPLKIWRMINGEMKK